nr:PD-(D/E)XK motif protein [uncultured Sphaerochaeta sp.]
MKVRFDSEALFDKLSSWWNSKKVENFQDLHRYGSFGLMCKWDWYVGFDDKNCRDVVLRLSKRFNLISKNYSSRNIKCYEDIGHDGYTRVHFTLLEENQTPSFLVLCQDLISTSETANTEDELLPVVLDRLILWKAMLDSSSQSIEAYQGLFGELLIIRNLISQGRSPDDVISSWTGPDGDEQDFVFNDCWYEIKTIKHSAMTVSISSAGQLDRMEPKGFLQIIKVKKCDIPNENSLSVKSLVSMIKNEDLSNFPLVKSNFENKLVTFRYAVMAADDKYWFDVMDIDSYLVTDDFPKIHRSIHLPQMKSITYTLIVAALESWRI